VTNPTLTLPLSIEFQLHFFEIVQLTRVLLYHYTYMHVDIEGLERIVLTNDTDRAERMSSYDPERPWASPAYIDWEDLWPPTW
jgi:hypothetical protein